MRVYPDQLTARLRQGLAPVYLIYGDELLLAQEAADQVRDTARKQGYAERECLTVEAGFDWNSLVQTAATPSLFASRRILELRLGEAKPGEAGGKALGFYAQHPAADCLLLVTAGKLDAGEQKSRWFTALDGAGISVPVRPLEAAQLPAWIAQRMRSKGLIADADAVALLVERVEGNLLAAAQEIDKLYLLLGDGPVTAEQVLAAVSDSARYNVYDLVDAALAENAERTVRIVRALAGEGVEPVLVCWALQREVRLLTALAYAVKQGQAAETALSQTRVYDNGRPYAVWDKRKPLLRQALRRLPWVVCRRLVRDCARLDRVIKGAEPGNAWDEVLSLSLRLAGRALPAVVDV